MTATEVLGTIQAMTWALGAVGRGGDITVDHLLEAHRRLLDGTRLHEFAGLIRDNQNWIGGSSFDPCSAEFVTPPPELVRDLLDDLCAFCNTDDLPAIVQAAMAHAQFETVHPFVDGNGRIGRALIHLVLRRRGLAVRVLPPISLILATWSQDYVAGLTATRYIAKQTSDAASAGANQWIALFATACRRAIEDAETFEQRVSALQGRWRARLGKVRTKSAADRLIGALPGAPIVTVHGAAALIGRTYQATNEAMERLVEAKILRQVNVGQRNRAFEAPELIRTFTDLERRLASPAGDTRSSPPARRVPPRQERRRAGNQVTGRRTVERTVTDDLIRGVIRGLIRGLIRESASPTSTYPVSRAPIVVTSLAQLSEPHAIRKNRPVEVRPATSLDLDALAEVHVQSWQETYKGQVPQDYLDAISVDERRRVWADAYDETRDRAAILVLVDDGTVVGFTRVCPSRDADAPLGVGEVASIYLLASHSGRGGGRALMTAALEALSERGFLEATLWVFETNEQARRFYEANGWQLDGAEKRDSVGGAHIAQRRYRRSLS